MLFQASHCTAYTLFVAVAQNSTQAVERLGHDQHWTDFPLSLEKHKPSRSVFLGADLLKYERILKIGVFWDQVKVKILKSGGLGSIF